MILALVWDNNQQALAARPMPNNRLTRLRTAVAISLFTHARANDEQLEIYAMEQQGFWGDPFTEGGESLGPLLWLLHRQKLLPSVINQAQNFANDSLLWLLDEPDVSDITVTAWRVNDETIGLHLVVKVHGDVLLSEQWEYNINGGN